MNYIKEQNCHIVLSDIPQNLLSFKLYKDFNVPVYNLEQTGKSIALI